MKLLADENFPPSLVSYLQRKRHDVKRIQRSAKGSSDLSVYERAIKENRIIITFDKDFSTKREKLTLISVMIFDFPNVLPEEIIPLLDLIMISIKDLKSRKKFFIVSFSKKGLELKDV